MESKTVTTTGVEQVSTPTTNLNQEVVSTRIVPDQQEYSLFKINQIVWYIIGLVNLLILLRFVLLLLSARTVGFVNFIYNLSQPFVSPFLGIFPSASSQGSYFETAALVAVIAYVILGFVINGLLNIFSQRGEVAS